MMVGRGDERVRTWEHVERNDDTSSVVSGCILRSKE